MNDIQNVMLEKFTKNDYSRILLRYAAILIYVSVGYSILGFIPMPGIISKILGYVSRIIYFGYIAGLIGCFAKKDFLPIAVVFLFKAATSLISCIRWFGIGSIVNIIVYGILGYFALKCYNNGKNGNGIPMANGKKFCPNCGQEVSEGAAFCGSCGNNF